MKERKAIPEKATILVVDDEDGIREVFAEMISDLGYRVVSARDSEEATELVRKEPVKMAFVDNWMPPGLNGIEAIKRWKEQGLLTFPAVVVTGYAKIESAAEAMRSGAYDVLSKPIKREQVEALLGKVRQEADTEVFDPILRNLDMGRSRAMTKLKGELMRAASMAGNPVTMVGGPNDGCEYFAMFLHPVGKPWMVITDPRALEANPTVRLGEARHGTVYVKHIDAMSPAQQRGLELMARNANTCEVLFVCESQEPIGDLAQKGKIERQVAEVLEPVQVHVPPLDDYLVDLPKLLGLVTRYLCDIEGFGEVVLGKDAISALITDSERWTDVGLDGLVAVSKNLLRGAKNGHVAADKIARLLNSGTAPGQAVIDESIFDVPLRESRNEFEKMYLKKLLERSDHNYEAAAKSAGIERTYLYRKVKTVLGTDLAKEA